MIIYTDHTLGVIKAIGDNPEWGITENQLQTWVIEQAQKTGKTPGSEIAFRRQLTKKNYIGSNIYFLAYRQDDGSILVQTMSVFVLKQCAMPKTIAIMERDYHV